MTTTRSWSLLGQPFNACVNLSCIVTPDHVNHLHLNAESLYFGARDIAQNRSLTG
jgi:hypothetical protein